MTFLYTFIMEYLGGTYISQVKAANNRQAMDIWIRDLKIEEVELFSKKDQEKIIKDAFVDEEPILIRGMKNVWIITVRTKKGFGLVNFIKTHEIEE